MRGDERCPTRQPESPERRPSLPGRSARAVSSPPPPSTRLHGSASARHVVALEGRVDPEAIRILEHRVASAIAQGHNRLVVDLSAVTLLVLPALSPFCHLLRDASRDGVTLTMIGGHRHVRRTVELCAIEGVELR
jgi:anti-anti-sigma regulatory factor